MRKILIASEPLSDTERRRHPDRYIRANRFHPTINRWTGKPHDHAQEIARRARQAERRA